LHDSEMGWDKEPSPVPTKLMWDRGRFFVPMSHQNLRKALLINVGLSCKIEIVKISVEKVEPKEESYD